jgi:hypothetical protein
VISVDINKMGWEDVYWIHLSHDRGHGQAVGIL